ncbi:MAG: Holliday junction resolvase RuvX [bacterium]
MSRLLGIDPGLRRIGLALSDEMGIIARPLKIIDRKVDNPLEIISNTVENWNVSAIVIGYPTPLKTKKNERTCQVDEFIKQYLRPLGIPVEKISERYTTRQAEQLARERGAKKAAGDDQAAALILQYYINQQRSDNP